MDERHCANPECRISISSLDPRNKYCSKKNRARFYYLQDGVRPDYILHCCYSQCCNFFRTKRKLAKYCSKECQKAEFVDRNRARYAANPQKYAEAREQYRQTHLELWADIIRRRRNKLRTQEQEFYRAQDIYERDKWICQLCLLIVDSTLKFPHPKSASIDHKTPVSHGGADTPANVQLAHLECNWRKGNRAGQS